MYLVTANEMREMDRRTIEEFGIPGMVLMENAGRGAVQFLLEKFSGLSEKQVGVIAGRGNNGGDGFVIARYLSHKDIRVTVYLLTKGSKVRGDAAANLKLLLPLNVPVIEVPDQKTFTKQKRSMRQQDLWVDAILGTGLQSDVKGFFKNVIDFINNLNKPIFAVDIPSGLNSDTGQPCGTCIRADATATFAFAKTGHLIFPGASLSGDLEIVDIGIPPHIVAEVNPLQYFLTHNRIRDYFGPRPPDAHKGNTGHVLILAGSPGKTGAAAMTAMSAMRVGAGLVTLGVPESLNPVLETLVLEAMTCPLPETNPGVFAENSIETVKELLIDKKCLALGPGVGTAVETRNFTQHLLKISEIPVVIDADGLNNLVGDTQILKNTKVPVILTPHPGEMARLTHTSPSQVQADRITCARDFAVNFNVH
ncbi:NAD(P)H-hydrate epimerase, partial [Thermodesulfobacteriota bacterium]